MDSYKVVLLPHASGQLNQYISYLQYNLRNDQAARSVWRDAVETQKRLSEIAKYLKFCEDPVLKNLGYRIIHFKSHRYLMIYRIEDDIVYVDAVYHSLQDYEALFSDSL